MIEYSGEHSFKYSVAFDYADAPLYKVASEAAAYRMPPLALPPYEDADGMNNLPPQSSPLCVSADNIRVSAIYRENGSVIIRLFEAAGMFTPVTLTLPGQITSAVSENFIGETGRPGTHDKGRHGRTYGKAV